MNPAEVFSVYVKERREQDLELFTAERFDHLVRFTPLSANAEGLVAYANLTPGLEQQQIENEVVYFKHIGREFEWKLYDLDTPPHLAALLEANDFHPAEEEAFMLCSLADRRGSRPPTSADSHVRRIHDDAGIRDVVAVQEQVWSRKFDWLVEQLHQTVVRAPQALSVYCAYAGDRPIGTGWTDFAKDSAFPELHGGSVVAEWRGRGVYSSLYDVRLAEASARGYQYLTVDASPMSRPILEKLGFQFVCRTVPMLRRVD